MFALSALLAGCAGPAPGTPAAVAEESGQKCRVCLLENPGAGNDACLTVCRQHEADQAAYLKSIGR